MHEMTLRGLKLLGLGVLFFLVKMALSATGDEGVAVMGSIIGLVGVVLALVGISLAVVGLF